MKKLVTSFIAATVLMACWICFAQVQEKPKDKPAQDKNAEVNDADEDAIRHSAEAFTTAYNAHNAKAVSELFALKAEFTDEDGNLIKGREAIEQDFATMFKNFPECKVDVDVTSVRVLTPNIALEEGIVRAQPVPDNPANSSSYVAVHVKVDGHWLIASVSDFEDDDSEELTPSDHLQQLAWMEGSWIDESPDSIVKTSCRWDDSGNYLLHEFYVQIAGGLSASGSMRIGWDPLSGQLKSWLFDADGSYSEGLWIRVDNEWIVKCHGVNAAGQVTSAVNVFRYLDNDTMTWRSYDRVTGGNPSASIPENVIKRHAPPPAG
jgi:uncharacterized protein (TIGR02246 family)